jgi:hypothetical protein
LSEKQEKGLPYDASPMGNRIFGQPEDVFELINKYGTYNIQPTADSDHIFPMIAPGLPRKWRRMWLDKPDLERR